MDVEVCVVVGEEVLGEGDAEVAVGFGEVTVAPTSITTLCVL